jgi:hypothetical protein
MFNNDFFHISSQFFKYILTQCHDGDVHLTLHPHTAVHPYSSVLRSCLLTCMNGFSSRFQPIFQYILTQNHDWDVHWILHPHTAVHQYSSIIRSSLLMFNIAFFHVFKPFSIHPDPKSWWECSWNVTFSYSSSSTFIHNKDYFPYVHEHIFPLPANFLADSTITVYLSSNYIIFYIVSIPVHTQ